EDSPKPFEINSAEWIETLQTIPAYGGLQPAAVTFVGEDKVTALLENAQLIDILWENGLSEAAPYINENVVGAKPESPGDVVKIGDVVRVRKIEDTWHLSQLPEAQASLVA